MQTISPSWSGVWAAEPALQRLSIAAAHPIQTERPGDWLLVSLKPSLEIASPCISFIAQDPIVALGPRSYFKLVTKHCQSDWHCVEICKSRLSFSKGRADWHRKNRATVAWEFPCCICKFWLCCHSLQTSLQSLRECLSAYAVLGAQQWLCGSGVKCPLWVTVSSRVVQCTAHTREQQSLDESSTLQRRHFTFLPHCRSGSRRNIMEMRKHLELIIFFPYDPLLMSSAAQICTCVLHLGPWANVSFLSFLHNIVREA